MSDLEDGPEAEAEFGALLEHWIARLGKKKATEIWKAASPLHKGTVGRPPIDDDWPVLKMWFLLEHHEDLTLTEAAQKSITGNSEIYRDSDTRRLVRKYKILERLLVQSPSGQYDGKSREESLAALDWLEELFRRNLPPDQMQSKPIVKLFISMRSRIEKHYNSLSSSSD